MKILFSPVGMSDPLTIIKGTNNYNEAALLQLCRYSKPDLLIIYLSAETLEFEEKDQRYTKSINLLKRDTGMNFNVKLIKRPDLVDVHLFDVFIKDFQKILSDINFEYPDSEIYLNVSSGTPAMKSALQIISAATNLNLIPIQVSNRSKKANNPHIECNIEKEWENNVDNLPDAEIRAERSQNTNLLYEFNKKLLESLIKNYDYHAAAAISEQMGDIIPNEFRRLLEAVSARYDLNNNAAGLFKECGYSQFIPYENIIIEYFLLLRLQILKGEYTDFLRALTPFILELFYDMTGKSLGIDLNLYTESKFKWDINKLQHSPLSGKFSQLDKYHNPDGGKEYADPEGYIYSGHIANLTENLSSDEELIKKTLKIRKIEERLRNEAAHTMTKITKAQITTYCQVGSPTDIIDMLYSYMTSYTAVCINDKDLHIYDMINKELIELLNNNK